ncbi:UDP-N-acetylglucosamine transferase subunit ALG13 [Lepeophtheirus salmonis]|uniref:UDP-N-acetylglucosamine transferase subunit ALG13 n=1 Tax=Lepeophtheirus salmonis TaxID=72036 RepID=UPI001AE6C3A4|nr:UDP-N-acetylglucosamine transferase subunit ALG13 homolog [Lepeophtheirus salmonis]
MRIFVTVGTTQFDALISAVLFDPDLNSVFIEKNVTHLTLQVGNSKFSSDIKKGTFRSIELYKFSSNILPDIEEADLVISHAGAGSCFEVLCANKPLLIVVNEALMGNHQNELADKLKSYAAVSSIDRLAQTLKDYPFTKEPFPEGNPKAFSDFIESIF